MIRAGLSRVVHLNYAHFGFQQDLAKWCRGKTKRFPNRTSPNWQALLQQAASQKRVNQLSSWLLYNLMTHLWCQSSRSASNLWVLHIVRIIKNILIDLMFQFHWKTHINIEFSDDKRLSIHSPTEIVEKALDLYIQWISTRCSKKYFAKNGKTSKLLRSNPNLKFECSF